MPSAGISTPSPPSGIRTPPTPAKTPQKHPSEKNDANINAIARNLFPVDDDAALGGKKKKAKKYSGLSLESFTAEEDPIKIYTDSHERLPELDTSADIPFY